MLRNVFRMANVFKCSSQLSNYLQLLAELIKMLQIGWECRLLENTLIPKPHYVCMRDFRDYYITLGYQKFLHSMGPRNFSFFSVQDGSSSQSVSINVLRGLNWDMSRES